MTSSAPRGRAHGARAPPPLRSKISKLFFISLYFLRFLPIFKIKWPKSEEKINFGGRLLWSRPRAPPLRKSLVRPLPRRGPSVQTGAPKPRQEAPSQMRGPSQDQRPIRPDGRHQPRQEALLPDGRPRPRMEALCSDGRPPAHTGGPYALTGVPKPRWEAPARQEAQSQMRGYKPRPEAPPPRQEAPQPKRETPV